MKKDLLNCIALGETWYKEFKDSCFVNKNRFEAPIKRPKLKKIASDARKNQDQSKGHEVKEVQGTWDLFSQLLYLAASNKIDLKKVFAYSLTPVPLVCGHKTEKLKCLHKQESKIDSSNGLLDDISAYIVMPCF